MLTKVEGTIKGTVEGRSLVMGGFSKIYQGPFGEKESTMGMQLPHHPVA